MMCSEQLMGTGSRVSITPEVVRSESWHTYRITITLGEGGLATTDSLGLVCGSNIDRWHFQFASSIWGRYAPFQVNDPAAPNYLSAACPQKQAALCLKVGRGGPLKAFHNQPDHIIQALHARYRYVLEISADEPLEKGDTIEVIWGERRFGSPGVRAPAIALRYHFFPFKFSLLPRYDRDLPFRRGEFDTMPTVRVIGQEASRFHVTAPALAAIDRPFSAQIAAIDKYGNHDRHYTGEVRLRAPNAAAGNRRVVRFRRSDDGKLSVEDLVLDRPGWTSISACALDTEVRGESNPILCSEKEPERQILWGAMHGHTLDCDGILTARDHYEYARETACLDFAACASHAEYFNCKAAWERYLQETQKAGAHDDFTTFYGYEWAGEGHINGYFLKQTDAVNIYGRNILKGDHPPDNPEFRIPQTTTGGFLETLKQQTGKRLAIAHFHTQYGEEIDDEILRLHEVYSMHQQNPREEKYRAMLERGHRIGAVAGSDSHRWGVGHLCEDPDATWNQPEIIDGEVGSQSIQKKCGLQATLAEAPTAESIWEAMTMRHTYGTTGARIVLLFHLNDHPMGEVVKVSPAEPLTIRVNAGGTAELREVTVVMFDGESWSEPFGEHNCSGRFCDVSWEDQAVPGRLYFVRVVQIDGETAWSSPIWLT